MFIQPRARCNVCFITSLRAGSLVWTGIRDRELARRTSLRGFSVLKWACSQANLLQEVESVTNRNDSRKKQSEPGRYKDRLHNFCIRKFFILSILSTDRSGMFTLHICLDLRKRCWRIWILSPIFHLDFTTPYSERTAMKRRYKNKKGWLSF